MAKDISNNFPPVPDQFRASTAFAREVFNREERKRITEFGQAGFIEEHLSEDEYGVDYGGFPANFILIIAAIRRGAELSDENVPEEVSLGMTIIMQVKENFAAEGYKWPVPDDRFDKLLDMQCRHALFTNTEFAEDDIQEVLDIDTSSDTTESPEPEPCVLGS